MHNKGLVVFLLEVSCYSAGCLFYNSDSKKTYKSIYAAFDEQFTSPLYLPDLPCQGAIRLQNIKSYRPISDPIIEHTGDPTGDNEYYPNNTDLPCPKTKCFQIDIAYLSNDQQERKCKRNIPHIHKYCMEKDSNSNHNHRLIYNFFASVLKRPVDNLNHSDYLNISHGLKGD